MASCIQIDLSGNVQGILLEPDRRTEWGILVLAGSSGRVDVPRASLFASIGVTSLALRWFGGEGQAPGICEVPLETFVQAIDELEKRGCKLIAIAGTSKGAEAALLVATRDERVDAVFAMSPTSVVWGNIGPGRDGIAWPERSSWTWKSEPLPFVPTDPSWTKEYANGLVSYRSLFEHCLQRFAKSIPAATIPVEQSRANIVLIAGGSDALWPSESFARSVLHRRQMFAKEAELICDPEAGHRILLPAETTPRSSLHAHGGSDEADTRLGRTAWVAFANILGRLA
ncbi:acyl-CoA thioester hydrolase/BAAT C-terminal domain-containing protein [Rhizobium mongolense]|uniref:acyl-CoA thioester hydrolase/BAAT C-terminal domain-containing protein n=1 Tax=Rhizobium mongolense TaxID=57676 RepID=UPI003557269A